MSNSKYDETSVVKSLSRKKDLRINPGTKTIIQTIGAGAIGDVGIKSYGKIDYLKRYCGYTLNYSS